MERPPQLDPIDWLRADRRRAAAASDPCANLCTVASIDAHGQPSARTLVLREVEGRFAVFTNRTSPKWSQLADGGSVALVVWLPTLQLQYRLQCRTSPVPGHLVHASWQQRPPAPKRLDWYYTQHLPQGAVVGDRQALIEGLERTALPDPLVAPPTAGGLFVEPISIDRLDLTQPDGIHDRRHFERHEAGWLETVRVP